MSNKTIAAALGLIAAVTVGVSAPSASTPHHHYYKAAIPNGQVPILPVLTPVALDIGPEEARSCANLALKDFYFSVLQQVTPRGVELERIDISLTLNERQTYVICATGTQHLNSSHPLGRGSKITKVRIIDTRLGPLAPRAGVRASETR